MCPPLTSNPLRPTAGLFERLAGFEETLQAGQNQRPFVRNRLDELRFVFVDLVDESELDRIALFFKFIGQTRKSFGSHL